MRLLCIAMILSCAVRGYYTVLLGDDFTHANDIRSFQFGNIPSIVTAIKFVNWEYHNWLGAYFAMFMQAFLSPANYGGLALLRFDMLLNQAVIFGGFWFLLHSAVRLIPAASTAVSDFTVTVIYTVLLFFITGYDSYAEIFSWYSGATSYGYPVGTLAFAAGCVLNMLRPGTQHRRCWQIAALTLGLCAMGGSLTVAAAGCSFMAVLTFYQAISQKRVSPQVSVTFGVWLAGALINTLAPGNYIRQAAYGRSKSALAAFNNSIYTVQGRYTALQQSNWISLLLIIVLVGIMTGYHSRLRVNRSYFACSLLGLFVPVIVAFPVALGYGGQYMPNRTAFIVDCTIFLVWINIAFCAGAKLIEATDCSGTMYRLLLGIVSLMTVTAGGLSSYGIEQIKSIEVLQQWRHNEIQQHYEACVDFCRMLDQLPDGTDVILTPNDLPKMIPNVHEMNIDWNADNWRNIGYSDYFGLGSISVKDPEEQESNP